MKLRNPKDRSGAMISAAVCRSRLLSTEGLRERLFTLAFSILVYPQIWEDPVVDLEALKLDGDSRVITIASGGCNVLNYLTAAPAHITAVDINAAHVALNRLKLAAARHLPDYAAFCRFFGAADAPTMSPPTSGTFCRISTPPRAILGLPPRARRRRRIGYFGANFYRHGLLGGFIGAGHLLARMHGANPRRLLAAKCRSEQRRIFERELAPLFKKRHIRWLLDRPSALFRSWHSALRSSRRWTARRGQHGGRAARTAGAARLRLRSRRQLFRVAGLRAALCERRPGPLPPYLQRENFEVVRDVRSTT